jgi:hypothetical protein
MIFQGLSNYSLNLTIRSSKAHIWNFKGLKMSNMDLIMEKMKSAKNVIFLSSRLPSYAIRHTHHPSSKALSYCLRTTFHSFYPTNPVLHTNQTTLDDFRETPTRLATCPPLLLHSLPTPSPPRLKPPCTITTTLWAWSSTFGS